VVGLAGPGKRLLPDGEDALADGDEAREGEQREDDEEDDLAEDEDAEAPLAA
jgi:hypothetical protein